MKRMLLLSMTLTLCGCGVHPPADNRPPAWAVPVEAEGVPNLHKVSETLYRGDQPTAAGMRALEKLGIRTALNLRAFHSDRDEIGNTGLRQEQIFMKAWHPEREDAVKFLQLATDPKNAPVFVHCQHGADRTGAMCAVYRLVVQGWSKQEAVREMKEGGFGFHTSWDNLAGWIEGLDVERLKKEAESK